MSEALIYEYYIRILMAVQWDSEKGFNGVAVDVFDAIKDKIFGIKNEIPEITDEVKEALDVIYDLNKNGDIDLSTLNSEGINRRFRSF